MWHTKQRAFWFCRIMSIYLVLVHVKPFFLISMLIVRVPQEWEVAILTSCSCVLPWVSFSQILHIASFSDLLLCFWKTMLADCREMPIKEICQENCWWFWHSGIWWRPWSIQQETKATKSSFVGDSPRLYNISSCEYAEFCFYWLWH